MAIAKSKSSSSSRKTTSEKSGIVFPVAKIAKRLVRARDTDRVSPKTPVYIAAALQYAMAELIELSAQSTAASGRKRIAPKDIIRAYQNDAGLWELFQNHRVLVGGAIRRNGRDFAIKADVDYEEHRKKMHGDAVAA